MKIRKILLVASVVCFQKSAFGMTQNHSSQYQHTVYKSWSNPIEALTVIGLLGDSTFTEETVSSCPKTNSLSSVMQDKPLNSSREIRKNPELYEYINLDPEETVSSCPKTNLLSSVMQDKSSNSSRKIRWHNSFKKKRDYYKCTASPYSYFYSYPFPPLANVCFHKRFSKTPYKVKCIERLNRMNKLKKTFTKYLYIHECSISNGTANQDLMFGITHGIIQKNSQNDEEYTFVNHKLDLFTREITKFNF